VNGKLLIGSILLAISAGCAVDAGDEPQTSTVDDEVGVRCSGVTFREEFFAEAAMINLVGTRSCNTCFGTVSVVGTITQFGRLARKFVCDLR
jgi:hypothetical protein